MTFSSYYLFFPIDRCHFVVGEVDEIATFDKADCFKEFVTSFMSRCIQTITNKKDGVETYCKMMLNSSYGFDILNEEKYSKVKFCNYDQTLDAQARPNFIHTRQINPDLYVVSYHSKYCKCNTCIQEGVFTLDNAKYAYCSLVYDFMHKCLDMDKIHFIEGDTDSSYWAIAGDPNKGIHQGFEAVIKDKEFYDKHVYEWMPDPEKGIEDMKKLGGVAIEKEGNKMIAIAAKNYTLTTEKYDVNKCKGVSMKRNKEITAQSYTDVIETGKPVYGENCGLHVRPLWIDEDAVTILGEGQTFMVKDKIEKVAISGVHTKMIVLSNPPSAPYVFGPNANDYDVV
jgi:hypothetical protein